MKLSTQTVNILSALDYRTLTALEEVRKALLLEQVDRSFKKDTEFDTLWFVAELEGRKRGILDLMDVLYNPKKYERPKADEARRISQES